MGTPTAPIDICNLALDHLAQGAISSIETPTRNEESIMARHYDPVRRALLREYIWNFAKKRVTISRTGTPEFDYADAYLMPIDCVRVLSIAADNEDDWEMSRIELFDIEGRNILCSNNGDGSIKLRYTFDNEDVNQFDPLFVNILAIKIALKVAYKFSLKPGLVQALREEYKEELAKAISVDGQERPPRKRERSKFVSRRRMGMSGNVASRYVDFS